MAHITIADTGKGMTDAELEKIFLPFFTRKKGGTGIGLSLSKKIISDHGGLIKVQSMKGKGTSFSLYLPFRDDG
jgi:signal transduction histidine kinase